MTKLFKKNFMYLKALKLRLYPNKDQKFYINKLLGSSRYVYNKCLGKKIESYEKDETIENLSSLGKYFHGELLKEQNISWLKEHNTKVIKQSIINMLQAYQNFFNNGSGYPKFKCKHDKKASCRFPKEAISTKNDYSTNKLTLTKQLKNLKFKCSDKYKKLLIKNKENIKSATLTKMKSGKYQLSVLIETSEVKTLPKTENCIGLDLGIKDFVITSNGEVFQNLKLKRNNEKKLNRLHKNLSRRVKGSKNREKARIKLARCYEKLTNKKEDYLHKVSNTLLNENQVIVMENLNVSGMLKNHKLARSVQEVSFFRFKSIMRYKSEMYGRELIEVDRFFPSSKTCNNCGTKKEDLKLSDRAFKCDVCGHEDDRDVNAAKNILDEGLRIRKEQIPDRIGELTPLES